MTIVYLNLNAMYRKKHMAFQFLRSLNSVPINESPCFPFLEVILARTWSQHLPSHKLSILHSYAYGCVKQFGRCQIYFVANSVDEYIEPHATVPSNQRNIYAHPSAIFHPRPNHVKKSARNPFNILRFIIFGYF